MGQVSGEPPEWGVSMAFTERWDTKREKGESWYWVDSWREKSTKAEEIK